VKTPEVSTQELREILANRSATVLDSRPRAEYAVSHIPGALNVSAKPGVPISSYVSDLAEIGSWCRTAGHAAGPVLQRSFLRKEQAARRGTDHGRLHQRSPLPARHPGLARPRRRDRDRVRRPRPGVPRRPHCRVHRRALPRRVRQGLRPGRKNIPQPLVLQGKDVGELKKAKDDGRLPMTDHNAASSSSPTPLKTPASSPTRSPRSLPQRRVLPRRCPRPPVFHPLITTSSGLRLPGLRR